MKYLHTYLLRATYLLTSRTTVKQISNRVKGQKVIVLPVATVYVR